MMTSEILLQGSARRVGEVHAQDLSPVKTELAPGKKVEIQGFAQYFVQREIMPGIVVAKLMQSANPAIIPPTDIVLHSVGRIKNESAERQTEQTLIQHEALRSIDYPALLCKKGAVVAQPIGYLDIQEGPVGQEVITGTYTVTEFFGTHTLEDAIASYKGKTPMTLVAQVILDVGKTIAAAHSEGITHRDIKPSNILLRDARLNTPKTTGAFAALADWGTAHRQGENPAEFSWGVGTPGYMPPEQYPTNKKRGADDSRIEAYDTERIAKTTQPPIDVYALGMTIYSMLGGTVPNFMEVLVEAAILGTPLDANKSLLQESDLESVCNGSQALKKVLQKATIIDQRQRYQSAKEMLADLQPFFANYVDAASLQQYFATLP